VSTLADYALHLADNALILGQRNAEWCGHGPVLEEDLALANHSLDLIGQARLLYQWVAQLRGDGSTEDTLAYFRDPEAFFNFTLLELLRFALLSLMKTGHINIQDLRVDAGIDYGDKPEYVDFDYLTKVASLAKAMASSGSQLKLKLVPSY